VNGNDVHDNVVAAKVLFSVLLPQVDWASTSYNDTRLARFDHVSDEVHLSQLNIVFVLYL
jgi:hypothetical protein